MTRIAIAALTLATAAIHIAVAIPDTLVPFYLNGLGYVALLLALFLPQTRPFHHLVRWVLMGYAALTIVLWLFLGQPYTPIGYVDKAIEVALIVVLWLEARRTAAAPVDA